MHMHIDKPRRDKKPVRIMHLIDARLSLHLIHIDDPLNPLIVEERHIVHDAKIALHIRQ